MTDHRTEAIERILKVGRPYYSAVLPNDIPRGRVGDCFDHCAVTAARSMLIGKRYRYVEGIALDPMSRRWFLHAWLTDDSRCAYDPTWKATRDNGEEIAVPTTYIGVEMTVESVAAFLKETGYKSVFANAWRAPLLSDRAIRSCLGG